MAAHARSRQQIRLQSRAARGIAAGEGKHDRGRRRHGLIFARPFYCRAFFPHFPTKSMTTENQVQFRTWMCLICGWVYDEAAGLPEEGIAPGTRWEDVPMNWTCPECGARKDDFEMVEI